MGAGCWQEPLLQAVRRLLGPLAACGSALGSVKRTSPSLPLQRAVWLNSPLSLQVNMDKLKERAQRFGLNVSSLSKKVRRCLTSTSPFLQLHLGPAGTLRNLRAARASPSHSVLCAPRGPVTPVPSSPVRVVCVCAALRGFGSRGWGLGWFIPVLTGKRRRERAVSV